MNDQNSLSPCDPATLFLQLAQPRVMPAGIRWYNATRIKGKGSQKFLKTLSRDHLRNGYSRRVRYTYDGKMIVSKDRHRIVSPLAVSVWENPEQRTKWLAYHKAISRLVPQ